MMLLKGLLPVAMIAAAAAVNSAGATTYVIKTTADDYDYDDVPTQITTGDSFQFNFGGEHNALAAADNTTCTPLADLTGQLNSGESADYAYTFTKAGTYYFICTKPNHCQKGMRASVVVVDGTASAGTTTFKAPATSSSPAAGGSSSNNAAASTTSAPAATTTSAAKPTSAAATASTSSKSGANGGAKAVALPAVVAAVAAMLFGL
ncbi:hypothetical protein DFJ73DRAFT_870966 [Zopfochytrium polystomum]|nr:hypothetical protein DFJ73DRAFT_870966 [Zopfochytrium polystomum]